MTSDDLPSPVFVSIVSVSGFLNGNCNFLFSAHQWHPEPDGGALKVVMTEKPVLDLRMDLFCAQQLRDALDRIIEQNTKPKMDS